MGVKFEPTLAVVQPGPSAPELRLCKIDGETLMIPRDIRDRWLTDVVRGPQWRDVLRKFDAVFATEVMPVNPEPEPEDPQRAIVTTEVVDFDWGVVFPGSAHTEEELAKLKVVHSCPWGANGGSFNVTDENQLYLLATQDITVPDDVWVLGYGAGQWLLDEKATSFLQNPAANKNWQACIFKSDMDDIIFEEDSDSHRASDSKVHTLRERWHLLEKKGLVDIKLGGPSIQRPAVVQQGKASDKCPPPQLCSRARVGFLI